MCVNLFVYFRSLSKIAHALKECVRMHNKAAFQKRLSPFDLLASSMSQLYVCAMQLESTAVHQRASVQQRSMMTVVVHRNCPSDFSAQFSLGVCVAICTVSSDLVGIPAQLLDVLQELVGAHVSCVQTGLMLAGHLRGPGRGFLTPVFICTHRQGEHSSTGCVPSCSLVNQA